MSNKKEKSTNSNSFVVLTNQEGAVSLGNRKSQKWLQRKHIGMKILNLDDMDDLRQAVALRVDSNPGRDPAKVAQDLQLEAMGGAVAVVLTENSLTRAEDMQDIAESLQLQVPTLENF